jgi:Ca2+/Na+ antiporter
MLPFAPMLSAAAMFAMSFFFFLGGLFPSMQVCAPFPCFFVVVVVVTYSLSEQHRYKETNR